MPDPAEEPTPPSVPGYTLQSLLGRGGSGEVWRAVPRAGGEPVAVKLLLDGDPETQAREAALLGALDHPHLVRLREAVHRPRRGGPPGVALVLDLLEGGSLATLIARRGRLRPAEVVTAVAPVAAAVAHAHEEGVVHGDLSPGNVVFTAEGRPVLTDLGVARLLTEEAAAQVTPAYVDPTVARGGAVGPASDVFGLAAAAFHALTGVAPWNGAGPADVLAVASTGLLPDLDELAPDAPAELRAVISQGLAADPHDRPTATAFALGLRHACRPEPVRLARPGAPDLEVFRTGAVPPVELTHQVPGRAPRPAPEVVLAGRRRFRRPDRVPLPMGRHGSPDRARRPRKAAAVLLVVGLAMAGLWLILRGATPDASARPPGTARSTVAPAATESTPTRAVASPSTASDTDPGGRSGTPETLADWRGVVAALYEARARAFATASAGALDAVYTEDSRLRGADAAGIAGLRDSGATMRGFAPEVVAIRSATVTGDRAELTLVDRWPGYTVEGDGRSPERVAATGERPVDMVLVRTDDGWRLDTARLSS
jgi:eukaryotic-like serine/threonine-protein kinase